MITAEYARTMARYNAWQNKQVAGFVDVLTQDVLVADRGAFFGSLQGTLSHLLWGDLLWMSRFDVNSPTPDVPMEQSKENFPTKKAWLADRQLCDGRITAWAYELTDTDLAEDLTWTLSGTKEQKTKPLGFCVMHFFNHQTHHRGQIHAMLTAAGSAAPVSDLSYLPEDA